jgi:two-component system, chemotaxis family, sensor kinase CheA
MAKRRREALGEGLDGLLGRTLETSPGVEEAITGSADAVEATSTTEPRQPDPLLEAVSGEACSLVVEDMDLLRSFMQECGEHLHTIQDKIIALEKAKDPDLVNEIFRCMHTMKGNSSFLGLTVVKEVSHSLEGLLDGVRRDIVSVSPELVDVLLAGVDMLLGFMDSLDSACRSVGAAGAGSGPVEVEIPRIPADGLLARVDRLLGGATGTPPQATRPAQTAAPPPPPKELVTDDIVRRFASESADLLDEAERALLELERQPERPDLVDQAFRAIHTIKGNSGFLALDAVESACMTTEGVLEALRSGTRRPSRAIVSSLLESVDAIRRQLAGAPPIAASGPRSGPEEAVDGPRPVGEILVRMGAATRDEVEHALDVQDRKVGEILVSEGKISPVALERALEAQKAQGAAGTEAPAVLVRKDIRVDMSKLDKLFDLMGELITAEAMVINDPDVLALELAAFAKASSYLSKITREMQEITMAIRMIPLDGLFNKMRRLVRDLERKSGKSIAFQVSGQDTEMDRNVIEEISDPLVHIIRNAIDHGIEAEALRRERGKSPAGTVSLDARYEGNEIWITVRDDGGGLDRGKILAKAAEKGMLKGDPASMKDQEVWSFIFEPGFSTAAAVSEVSGRGVGMDVVKRNIEKLRGKAEVNTERGRFTEVILRIPLTLAIIDGITVQVGPTLYALPLADILEFHKALPAEVTKTGNGREVIRVRDELIPVIKLGEFFHAQGAKTAAHEGIILVTRRGGAKAAFLADTIVGYQQIVVKALPYYLEGMRAISGCSVQSDGAVSLIVDSGALIEAELQ